MVREVILNSEELELIGASESIHPIRFIEITKRQKGSFVTHQEENLITDLIDISSLSDSVINILIHYLLITRDLSTIPTKLANTIAYDWTESGVRSSKDALIRIKDKAEAQEKKNEKNAKRRALRDSRSKGKNNIRKETLPDWVNEKFIPTIYSSVAWEGTKQYLPENHFQLEMSYQEYIESQKNILLSGEYKVAEDMGEEDLNVIEKIKKDCGF